MTWLSGYTYRKKGEVNPTSAGAQTNYQLKLVVGESSGASGEDVDCENHSLDFPNDIRFTKEDGETKHDYWIDTSSLTGSTPNREVSVWIEVASIPASGSVDFYMYYGKTGDSGDSSGDNAFLFFDDFGSVYYKGSWATKTAMTHAVADVPCVVYNNKLYCFGGYGSGGGDPKDYTQEYTPATNLWTDKTAMPTKRWGAAAAECNGKAYVFGGKDNGNTINKCECYDLSANSWTTKTNVPWAVASQGLMAVTVGSKIYLFYRQYTYEFDPSGNGGSGSYTQKLSTNPVDRSWATCAYVNVSGEDRIYVIGGYVYGEGDGCNKNYYYKPSTNTWSSAQATAPYSAYGQIRESCIYNGTIYYGFGQYPNGTFHKKLYRYNPNTNTWSFALTEASYVRDGVGAGIINDRLYVVGGRIGSFVGLEYNEEFNPTTSPQYVLDSAKWTEDAVNGITHTINNYFRFEDATKAGNTHWIFDNSNTGSQHQAKWTPPSAFILEWYSKISDTVDAQMGEGSIALIGSDNKISAHIAHLDDYGLGIIPKVGYMFVESTTGTAFSVSNGDERNFKIIVNGTSVKLYEKAVGADTYNLKVDGTSSDISKIALTAGAYGGYPFLDYIEIKILKLRKYADPEPTWGSWSGESTEFKTKESSAGLRIVERHTKASSAGLTIKDYGAMGCVMTYEGGSTYNDQTIEANNATINDVQTMFDTVGDILYYGDIATYAGVKIKYSTKGVIGSAVIVLEYSKGSGVWGTLSHTDESNKFTEDPGTYLLAFTPPGDWATDTVDGKTHYWIRYRLTSASYTINPELDQLWIFQGGTKESSAGLRIVERHTKASSAGLSIQETKTKTSTVGLRIVERFTKESSAGLRIIERSVKESSASLSVTECFTKESSAGLSVAECFTRISSAGLRIVTRGTKESSAGLSIYGGALLISSGGLAISEKKTKESSAGLAIIEIKTKASSAGLRIIQQNLKTSSASLTVKASYTKESSAGMSITLQQLKQSSAGLTISGPNTLISSAGLTIFESGLKKGLFYGKLGDVILETVMPESFRISEEINRIPTFEFEVANSEANRTAIAANPTALFKIYWQHHGVDTHIFTGIINADGIEYISLSNIIITGFASYAKLGWPLYKHLDSEDAEPVNTVFEYHGMYTDYTIQANNASINDVIVSFGNANHCFYIGEANPFWGLQVKYSTKGIPAGAVVVIEFSKGSGVWETLDALDETNAFTEEPGTYDVIISHPPSDWTRNTVDGISKFWIRWRIVSGTYTTAPKLDQIHTVNVDVYRVFYLATSARAILLDVLEDTEYTMDTTDACPEDKINILAEYESPLRVIAAIPAALTWTDTDGSKKSYQWWIDEAKKVHMKKERGTTHSDDITGDLTIFNNLVDYFNISNRLIGFSKRDGLSQIRAIVENTASQTTHALRILAVPKNEIGKYQTLKASLEKDITYSKDPMQRIKGSVTTEFWGQRGYEVGDRIILHQGEWVVEEGEFQIVKADIGPILTQLNLGISREHLEGLKSNLKRSFDISNVRMHGSTSLLTAGPETSNYERKADGSVFSAKLKIEIPSEVVKTHKVLLSWTIGPYRASVNEQTGEGEGHDHGGFGGPGGAVDGGFAGAGGAFIPDVLDGGDFIPEMLSEAHQHDLSDTLTIDYGEIIINSVGNEGVIEGLNHRHSGGGTGYPDDTADAVTNIIAGSGCDSGWCVTGWNESCFALDSHYHQNSDTGYTSPNAYIEYHPIYVVFTVHPYVLQTTSLTESPAHLHDGVYEPVHGHDGITEPAHNDHTLPSEPAHEDHVIITEPGGAVDIDYGIFEIPAGTILELLVNDEKIGEYVGDQQEIRVDGYLSSGTNTIEIQPIATETGKKGAATLVASGVMFIEPRRF